MAHATLTDADVLETLARQENASRAHDAFVLGELDPAAYEQWARVNLLSPPESLTGLCSRCRQPLAGPDDYADQHHDCAMQGLDEGFLGDAVERGIEQLAEGLRDYLKSRREGLESAAAREQVAGVREALRILRASRDQLHAAKVAPSPNAVR